MSVAPPNRDGAEALRRCRRIAVLAAVVTVSLAALADRLADARALDLRELRIVEQRLERRSSRLSRPGARELLAAFDESRDALRVRIVESLDAARGQAEVRGLTHRLDERALPGTTSAATLALALEGRIAHGAALLDLLQRLGAATAPWPSETRGCLVQRIEAAELQLDCAFDVLHWHGLRAPSTEESDEH